MTEYFVSTSGNNNNPGTETQPFRTIAKGVSQLEPGDTLILREGVYVESVVIAKKNREKQQKDGKINYITIRSYPGEHAYIDGSFSEFRALDNEDWEPARRYYGKNAHKDEYVSVQIFTEDFVNRGAFLDYTPYMRLITYSNLNDLRSDNDTFERIMDLDQPQRDPRLGPKVMKRCLGNDLDAACVQYQDGKKYKPATVEVACDAKNPASNCYLRDGKWYKMVRYRHPWVYMGPGIWFNRDRTSLTGGKIHIRLSHTSNNIGGLTDYTGETDPRKVGLAIAPKNKVTLFVRKSNYLKFENLTIRFGGEYSIHLQDVTGLVFDHVRICASSFGVRMRAAIDTTFRHCEFNGGLPTWYFRSDGKNEYFYVDGDKIDENILGRQTIQTLLLGSNKDKRTEIHHCEFINGHDLHLVGTDLKFHHNWINNLNDDGMFLDAYVTDNIQIYQNVITKCLSALSFAGTQVGGRRYIYRNLFDLRDPTAGYRPRNPNRKKEAEVWRYGQLYKDNAPDGPLDLFQNTFLVYGQALQAAYTHYGNTKPNSGNYPRRSFNNIFLAVYPVIKPGKPITIIPSPSFPAQTDGNNYYRMGQTTKRLYRYRDYSYDGKDFDGGYFASLGELCRSPLFEQSKSQYSPGYEANSIEENPQFRQIGPDGSFRESDDLRLGDNSPVIGAGVTVPLLPHELKALDPLAPSSGNPDIGCYPCGSGPLQVGVDSRRSYPAINPNSRMSAGV